MASTDHEPHARLSFLLQQSRTIQSHLLTTEDLHTLGVRVERVPLCPQDEAAVQFDPCFFRPYPDKLLHKYPIHPELDENAPDLPHLKYIRTLQDFVDDALTEHSPEFAPVVARAEYEFFQRDAPFTDCPDGVSPYAWDEFDPASHSLWVTMDIFNHLRVQRQGSFDGFDLEYIRLQRQTNWP